MPPLPLAIDLDHELGSGGSGRVWHGVLRAPLGGLPAGAQVALKRLHPELAEDPAARAALEREIVLGQRLRHPNLVHVVADGRDELGRWLLMPFVDGRSLREIVRDDGPLEEHAVRSLVRQLAGALDALHAAGWRHGDLKPENVRWTAEGRAVLMDLGLARAIGGDERARAGSFAYLAAEQARGAEGDARSDLFALGVLAYEAATGVHPFGAAAEPETLLEAIGEARILLPSLHAPRLRPLFDHLCVALCARDPAARPDAGLVQRVLVEGEQGAWWRERASARPGAPHADSPTIGRPALAFVGRDAELAELERAWQRAIERGGDVVWIDGEPGVGKSRLVHELAARLRTGAQPPVLLVARSSEWPEDRPAGVMVDLVARWFQLRRDAAPPASRIEALRARMSSADVDVIERALDPARGDPPGAVLTQVLVSFLLRVAHERPAILFLDDASWAGASTLDAVRRLLERLPGAPILVVLARRREVAPREEKLLARLDELSRERFDARELSLGGLEQTEILVLVEQLFEPDAPRLRIAHVLAERSGGSPALLAEILSSALARGEIGTGAGGALALFTAPEALPWPRSLSQAILESFRELPTTERAWLQRLAVVGGALQPAFLARAFGGDPARIEALLARLARAGWLMEQGARYRFARPVQRQAVYRMLSERRRIALHARAAHALASGASDAAQPTEAGARNPALEYQRAFHLREAHAHEELLALVPDLVHSAWGRAHPQRVHALASWGLESIDALAPDPERTRLAVVLLTRAADAADRLAWRAKQREWLDRLADLDVDAESDPATAGRVYLLHGRLAASTGDYGMARGLLHNARALFERARQRPLESEAARRLAYVQANVGELAQARELARRARELAGTDKQRALAEIALAVVDVLSDRFEPALRGLDRAIRRLARVPEEEARGVLANAQLVRGRTWRLLGRPRRAATAFARALETARLAGERRLEVEALARSGELLLELDRLREAEERLREALLAAREIEDRRGEALASLFLGILLAEGGRPEANELLARSIRVASESSLTRVASLGLAVHARVALERGDRATAWERAARARELLDRHGAELGDRIVIAGTEALLLRGEGRAREARAIARELAAAIRRESEHLSTSIARRRQRVASTRLLRAVLSPAGPIYPRVRLADLELGEAAAARRPPALH